MSKIGIAQPLPMPLNYFKTFSSKTKTKHNLVGIPQPLPAPLNFFKTFSSKTNNNKLNRIVKVKCPNGTHKNRKTKECEPLELIKSKEKRKYTKGVQQKCGKGTRRSKVTNNCEPTKK